MFRSSCSVVRSKIWNNTSCRVYKLYWVVNLLLSTLILLLLLFPKFLSIISVVITSQVTAFYQLWLWKSISVHLSNWAHCSFCSIFFLHFMQIQLSWWFPFWKPVNFVCRYIAEIVWNKNKKKFKSLFHVDRLNFYCNINDRIQTNDVIPITLMMLCIEWNQVSHHRMTWMKPILFYNQLLFVRF